MPSLKKIEENEFHGLTLSQKTYFVLGYTFDFLGDKEFPFADEEERRSFWKECKAYVQREMYKPRVHGNFRNPNWNSLRPEEYWKFDAPEPRRVLNQAKRLHPEDPDDSLWDLEPLEETDYEFLVRLNLLTSDDQNFIAKYEREFRAAEKDDTDYRKYLFEIEKSEKSQLTTKVGGPDQQTVNIDGNGGIEISNLSKG